MFSRKTLIGRIRSREPIVNPQLLKQLAVYNFKERFEQRIAKLVKNVSISLVARDEDCENKIAGVLFGLTDFCYWLYVTDLGVDRSYEKHGIGSQLMKKAHDIAGGEKDIAVYLIANENAIPFYEKLGMKKSTDVMQYNKIEWTDWTVE